jgi:hypothetical protein
MVDLMREFQAFQSAVPAANPTSESQQTAFLAFLAERGTINASESDWDAFGEANGMTPDEVNTMIEDAAGWLVPSDDVEHQETANFPPEEPMEIKTEVRNNPRRPPPGEPEEEPQDEPDDEEDDEGSDEDECPECGCTDEDCLLCPNCGGCDCCCECEEPEEEEEVPEKDPAPEE